MIQEMSNVWTLVCLGTIVAVFLPVLLLWDCWLFISYSLRGGSPSGGEQVKQMVHPGPEPGPLQVLGGPDDRLCCLGGGFISAGLISRQPPCGAKSTSAPDVGPET